MPDITPPDPETTASGPHSPEKRHPVAGSAVHRTWCCNTPVNHPHVPGCNFEPREDEPIDYTGPVAGAAWHLPIPGDIDWKAALAAGPGALWAIPHVEPRPSEPAIPVPPEVLAIAADWDSMFATLLGMPCGAMADAVRAWWLAFVGPRWCHCVGEPHCWYCPMTPIWAETIEDLNLNTFDWPEGDRP
ncbi:MAG: hypothetical protein AB1925_12625 [Actinomycetota bacterium]